MSFFEIITPADTAILNFIQQYIKCGFLDALMAFLSFIGEGGAIWVAAAIAMLFSRRTRPISVMLVCAMALGFISSELIIKNIICRPRPFIANPDIILNISPPSGFSCPSSHSCSSFAAATAIFIKNKKLGIIAGITAFLIAFSRLYNYVHYPSDVLFGALLGIVSAVIISLIFKKTGFESKLTKYNEKREV